MTSITTVTQKGQITLPVALRNMLTIKPYDQVLIKLSKGVITVEPVKDALDYAGTVPPVPGVDAVKAREDMEKMYHRV